MAEVPRIDRIEAPRQGNHPTLGTPAPNDRETQRRNTLSRSFSQRSSMTRNLRAPAEAALESVPILGPLAHREFTGGDRTLIDEYGASRPVESGLVRGAGMSAATPLIRGAGLASNAFRHGAVGAGDAAMRRSLGENEDPITRAASFAAGSMVGRAPSKAISPRGPQIHNIARRTRQRHAEDRRDPEYQRERADYVNARVPLTNSMSRRDWETNSARRRDAGRRYDREYFLKLWDDTLRGEFPDFNPNPRLRLQDLPDWARGAGAGLVSLMAGLPAHHSVGIGLAGALYGPAARGLERGANRAAQSRIGRSYLNNSLLNSGGARALDSAATGQATQAIDSGMPNQLQPYEAIRSQLMGPRR